MMICGIKTDSRAIQKGDLFLAYVGEMNDGRNYIGQAVQNGAVAIAFEANDGYTPPKVDIPCIPIAQLKQKLGRIAAIFYGEPSNDLIVFGVTGTNGKTSCVYFLAQLLAHAHKVGILSTIGNGVYPHLTPSLNTTVGAVDIQRTLAEFKKLGCQYVCMEVSSHSLVQGRINDVKFDTVIFTNLSRDHLDYHQDMEKYFQAKEKLFDDFCWQHAIVNADDTFGRRLLTNLINKHSLPIAYSLKLSPLKNSMAWFEAIEKRHFGFRVTLNTRKGKGDCDIPVLGTFNLYNVLAAISAVLSNDLEIDSILEILPVLKMPNGRMDVIHQTGKPTIVIDFAHTPDALEKALKAIRPFCRGELWCIFGCGGDRDEGKRAQMAKTVELNADCVVLTADNPRNEPIERIMFQTRQGFSMPSLVHEDIDRQRAIFYAIKHAKPNDVILIAGKGHEAYQEIDGVRHSFNEHAVVKEALKYFKANE
jgi:UDP-N-acetylmuramoyl-L-alanyl-D-glutamate--2,6-diaminopimelate ligase